MNLEKLLSRSQEIDNAILNMTAQLNALHGHKTELTHWISEAKNACSNSSETQVESEIEPMV